MNKRLTFRILFLLLLITLSVYILIHYNLFLLFEDRHKLVNLIRSYPYDELVFILLQIVQVVAAPIPGELTGIIGGYLYGPSGEPFIPQLASRLAHGLLSCWQDFSASRF